MLEYWTLVGTPPSSPLSLMLMSRLHWLFPEQISSAKFSRRVPHSELLFGEFSTIFFLILNRIKIHSVIIFQRNKLLRAGYMVENVWEEKEINRMFLFCFYITEWYLDNCSQGLGLGLRLVLGLGSNFPWGQLS